jgi:hypothetical protein
MAARFAAVHLAPVTTSDELSGNPRSVAGPHAHEPIRRQKTCAFQKVAVFVPSTKFKGYLSPQRRTIFGGDWREQHIR